MIPPNMIRKIFYSLYCLSLIQNFAGSLQTSSQELYEKTILEAKTSVEILTPGFFSIQLVKVLNDQASKGIHIRILLDSTYLDDPSNCIGILAPNLSLRLRKEVRLIPTTVVILDRQKVLIGGDYLKDNESGFFKPLTIKGEQMIKSYIGTMQTLWAGADPNYTNQVLTALEFRNDINLIQTNSGSRDINSTAEGFVASINSKVYHRLNSAAAKRIKPSNRIYFKTEAEAIHSKRIRAKNF